MSYFLFPMQFLALCLTVSGDDSVGSNPPSRPIVQTPNGLLQGSTNVSRDGNLYKQFLGIQFARVPARFELSVPVKAWEGIRLADNYGPGCDVQEKPEDEDCLYLSVYAPQATKPGQKLPVVVYIHGGGFQAGSSKDSGPNYFMDQEVILVAIQYRLGVFGFLSTEDEAAPGNFGLKDQVLGLEWVQRNIEYFGGNKDLVTLMGQSAGGASVTYHLVSPLSRGLFHRAIAQSGTFLAPWALTRSPHIYAFKLGAELGCPSGSSSELVGCLKSVPAKNLTEDCLLRRVSIKWYLAPFAAFGPVIEPDGASAFLSSNPYELLEEGNLTNRVPLLTGVTKEEGISIWAYAVIYDSSPKPCGEPGSPTYPWLHDLRYNWTQTAPVAFYYDGRIPKERLDEVSARIRDYYFGPDGEIGPKSLMNLSRLFSDRLIVNSAQRFIQLYSKHGPTYPYLYTFNKYWGLLFKSQEFPHKDLRPIEATHAAELDMLFSPLYGLTRNTTEHNRVSKRLLNLWTSFIRDGWPSDTYGSARVFPEHYPREGVANIKWYQIGSDTSVVGNIFKDRFKFWEELKIQDYEHNS